ncbi:hypothetical protein BCR34DRAFT_389678 [Clohesyomyces aquaticus]|uniref:Uncharacterized protein n=1 Tax=Clohesyomyces aquaticus TaxID=1231657 RepID=A0A1Y1ZEM1_9PLEO|nr:hypothetical protein BCR34DRAFT_389678 [Clohesyomyces aquaticus]
MRGQVRDAASADAACSHQSHRRAEHCRGPAEGLQRVQRHFRVGAAKGTGARGRSASRSGNEIIPTAKGSTEEMRGGIGGLANSSWTRKAASGSWNVC